MNSLSNINFFRKNRFLITIKKIVDKFCHKVKMQIELVNELLMMKDHDFQFFKLTVEHYFSKDFIQLV